MDPRQDPANTFSGKHHPRQTPSSANTFSSAGVLIAKSVKMGGTRQRFDAMQNTAINRIHVCFDPPVCKTNEIAAYKVREISQ